MLIFRRSYNTQSGELVRMYPRLKPIIYALIQEYETYFFEQPY